MDTYATLNDVLVNLFHDVVELENISRCRKRAGAFIGATRRSTAR